LSNGILNSLKPITLTLMIGVLATGCATGKHRDADDTKGKHKIDCSGTMMSLDDCSEKASEICGENQYDVLRLNNRFGTFRTMTIVCREQKRLVAPRTAHPPGGSSE